MSSGGSYRGESSAMKRIAPPREDDDDGDGLFSKLPLEITVDILAKVPLKSLARCRLVRKSWYFTIRNPNFIKFHMDTPMFIPRNSGLILQRPRAAQSQLLDRDLDTFNLKMPEIHSMIPTDYSSNGFVLLVSRTQVNRFRSYHYYNVCNPVTGEYVLVPRSPLFDQNDEVSVGFGYDPCLNICMIVRILKVYDMDTLRKVTKVEVCDVDAGEWRVIEGENLLAKCLYPTEDGGDDMVSLEMIDVVSSNFRPSVFCNGTIYWLGYRMGTSFMSIVSFDVEIEEFFVGVLPFPHNHVRNDLWYSERQPYLFLMGNWLSVVRIVGDHERVEIWKMMDFGFDLSWELKYVISNVEMDNGDLLRGAYMPVDFMPNGEILMVCSHYKMMCYYHPITKAVKFLDCIDMSAYYWRPLPHVCRLTSPFSISKSET